MAARAAREPGARMARTARSSDAGGRDPHALCSVVRSVVAERAWNTARAADDVVDRWSDLVPELARHVQAVGFDAQVGRLDLLPGSQAYAVQLRLLTDRLIQRLNEALGGGAVRAVRVVDPKETLRADPPSPSGPDPRTRPGRPRRTPSPGYREALAAHRASRPERGGEDPAVRFARERQAREQMREPEE
ncbi:MULTISPECIES: DUF721 domain-containing protein [unclassified Streptomyces]|uniref:DUF721 domain-containing protein n=1 Tax=unclassified Streptomyces TaxID=2593676 RepID=UPI0022700F37|nr:MULTISPECIES: DUF721 domain-containing protein [unclassified Streptomyces]MCY0924377.1 DUF721 domain-containing protein [Streptomyces sp. H27-G5]MCY0963452.1 DUF721 domain-containing protein [Streptomyces sp. H27-H5]